MERGNAPSHSQTLAWFPGQRWPRFIGNRAADLDVVVQELFNARACANKLVDERLNLRTVSDQR